MPSFDYNTFHKYYTNYDDSNLYDIAEDASAIIYTWKAYHGVKEKPKIARTIRQFRYKQIDKLARLKSLSAKYLDTYFILNERSSKRLEDQIFFVFPRHKFDQVTGRRSKHTFADHFSFQYNPDDKNTPVHLHETLYAPYNEEETLGDITRYFANFKIQLPIEELPAVIDKEIRDKNMLIDIVTHAFEMSGGKAKRIQRANGTTDTYGMFENKAIYEFCRDNNISQILVTYIRGFVNVVFLRSDGESSIGFSFEQERNEFTEAEIRRRIIDWVTPPHVAK